MINIRNLSFGYHKNKLILDDVSVDILDGECVILLGPNGAGKTTLINCLLGLNKLKTGQICFDNKDIKDLSQLEKATYLSYVPQLIEGNALTVKETIILGRLPHFYIAPQKIDFEKVEAIIQKFNLEDIKDKTTNEISGGEAQKVAIARAFVQEAKVVVFDEPTSNLDIKSQQAILALIKEHNKLQNCSSLISMHDINQALKIGTKFVFIKDNKIYKICQKEEITASILDEVYGVKTKIIHEGKEDIVIYED